MNEDKLEFDESNDLGYGDLFAKLWHRRFWFAGVFTGVLAISIPLVLAKSPVYQSYMQILAESNYQSKENNSKSNNRYLEQQFTDANIEVDYATQLKVLTSSEILRRVVTKIGTADSETSVAEATESLRDAISVYQVAEDQATSNEKDGSATKIIQTNYVGSSPTETKEVLEAVEEVYLDYNLEQQEKRLRDAITFIERRIPQARKELINAETALTGLTQENNLVSPEAEASSIKENIRQINQERKTLQAQRNEIAGNMNEMQEQLGIPAASSSSLFRLSQSPRYQKILNDLQATEQDIAAKQTKLTDNNPLLQSAIEEKESLKSLLYKEAKQVFGELPPNLNNAESLQKQGQLVESDTQIADVIRESQVKLAGIRQRDLSLAQTEVELKQKLVEFPRLISQYKSLSQESEIKRQALQRLLEAKQELEIELSRGGRSWQVIEPPQYGFQIAPNTTKDLLMSIVVATFLGTVAAFAKDATDEKINTPKEIESKTNHPILGTIPRLSGESLNHAFYQLPFKSHPDKVTPIKQVIESLPFREAIDLIYENLKLSYFSSPLISSTLKLLAVTSAISGEGKSTFVLGLALSVARQRQKVLVIDGDLRCPSLHEPFALDNRSGLTNFLAGEVERPAIQQVSFSNENIDLITAGSKTEDPVKLLNSSRFEKFIERQKGKYDLILVDTPPVIGMVDAIKIASICDTTLMVTRLNKTKISEFLETTALLSKLDILGIIINNFQDANQVYGSKSKYLLPQKV